MFYNEPQVLELYRLSLDNLMASLPEMGIPCTNAGRVGAVGGWVFQRTIQYCLQNEITARGLQPGLADQYSLGGGTKADVVIGGFAIEIRLRSLYKMDLVERHIHYKQAVNRRGLQYLFITKRRSREPYQTRIRDALGTENVFFLEAPGDWSNFVTRIVAGLTAP